MSRSSRHKKKSGRGILLLLVLFIAAGAVLGVNFVKSYNGCTDENSTETVEFVIESGSGTGRIAEKLEAAGLINNSNLFKIKSRLLKFDGKYQAGSFQLSKSMGMEDIMKALQDAKRETVRFTIPEGYTLVQVARKLADEGLVEEQSFYDALENGNYDYWFVNELGNSLPDPAGILSAKANRLEGFLFPDTYEVFKGASAEQIIDKMLSRFNQVFTDEYKEKADALGLSVRDAVTVASMIERECRADSERAKVASVIYNRFEIGMKLEFCSTALYSIGNYAKAEPKQDVTYADTQTDSPFNTYQYAGMPAGPIASPGKACLEAALNPEDTDYLYFVLKSADSVNHNFAVTYQEFLNYKNQYKSSF